VGALLWSWIGCKKVLRFGKKRPKSDGVRWIPEVKILKIYLTVVVALQ
jgi:hypothetical protein